MNEHRLAKAAHMMFHETVMFEGATGESAIWWNDESDRGLARDVVTAKSASLILERRLMTRLAGSGCEHMRLLQWQCVIYFGIV